MGRNKNFIRQMSALCNVTKSLRCNLNKHQNPMIANIYSRHYETTSIPVKSNNMKVFSCYHTHITENIMQKSKFYHLTIVSFLPKPLGRNGNFRSDLPGGNWLFILPGEQSFWLGNEICKFSLGVKTYLKFDNLIIPSP